MAFNRAWNRPRSHSIGLFYISCVATPVKFTLPSDFDPPNYASILCTKIGQKKLNGSVSPQKLQKAPKTPIARPSITPILRMDQVSSIYNPGNDFFWREEGPCRARARTSPARPSLGVPPTRCGGFPVTLLSQTRLNLQVSVRLGQPAWFATVPWTGTSRSQVGVLFIYRIISYITS